MTLSPNRLFVHLWKRIVNLERFSCRQLLGVRLDNVDALADLVIEYSDAFGGQDPAADRIVWTS